MFGVGFMLPWNTIMAAMDYFTAKFPDYKPSFSLLVAVSVPGFLTQLLVYFFLQYLPLQFKMTVTFLINSIVTVLLVLIPLVVKDQTTAYWITICLAVLFGFSYSILQVTLYGVAGPCAVLMNNLMLGVGLSGLIINAIRMIFLASIKNLDLEAQLFFYGSALFLFFCTYLSFTFVRKY